MNPVNLDEKTQNWHADATLPSTLRAQLSQAAPQKKRPKYHRPTLALRYGLAACVGVSLGFGFVASKKRPHQTQVQTLSQDRKSDKAPSNEMFQKVADTIKFWREPDEQAAKKKQRYEAILFTDLDCPSCKKAYPLLKKATSLRLGICQMPLTDIHPEALGKAIHAEADSPDGFWKQMSDGHEGVFIEEQDGAGEGLRQAKLRVAAMRAAAQAAGVTETPTLWVREGASADGASAKGFWVAIGAEGIKTVLEKLP
jgi:hypothetical protein